MIIINNTMLSIIPQIEKEKVFFRIENNDKVELVGIITKTERKGLIVFIKDLTIYLMRLNDLNKVDKQDKEIVVLYSNVKKPENRKLYESLGFEIIFEETYINF